MIVDYKIRVKDPELIIIDLFCGAGGTTTGFEMADDEIAMVIAAINHDSKAITSHWKNHPHVEHFEEDITVLYGFINHGILFKSPHFMRLVRLVDLYRAFYPNAKIVLWASLECTNFSKAKGGQPRDADSRTLADHLHPYIIAIDPDYIQIENVVEFMSWGPLDENGKPVSKRNGQDWLRWKKAVCDHGYYDDWKELNSADYGAYTSRNRLFGIFAKHDHPIAWPEPTHTKNPAKAMLFDTPLKKWKPVKDVLNFEDEGESIFTRKKALSDKTLERIYAGLIKYVAKGDKAFISKYYSGRPAGKVSSVDDPSSTVTTFGNQSLIQTEFLTSYYGRGFNTGMEEPAPTVTTKDRAALVQPKYFIDKTYTGYKNNQSIDQPAGAILPTDKHRLVKCEPFIMPTNYDNQPKSIEEPLQTITANRKHHYLVNPSYKNPPGSVDGPCFTLIAKQDKRPLSLVTVDGGRVAFAVYEDDTEIMIKIKEFMVIYDLIDIKMRMLRVKELLKIQGFPDWYELEGNQADQKKFIGNSVHPYVPKKWAEALVIPLRELKLKVA